jgi:hypothetical protein
MKSYSLSRFVLSLNAPGRIFFRPVFAREREVRYKKDERSPDERLIICKVNNSFA